MNSTDGIHTPYVKTYKSYKMNKAGELIEYTYNRLYVPRHNKPQMKEYITSEIQEEIINLIKSHHTIPDITDVIYTKINDNAKKLNYPSLTKTQIKQFLYRQR